MALSYTFLNLEPISCSLEGSNSCFLNHTQVSQGIGRMVCYSHLLKTFLQSVMIRTVEDFRIVDETEGDVILESPCFIYDAAKVVNLIFGHSSFSRPSLDIWNFLVCLAWSLTHKLFSMILLAWEKSAVVPWLAHTLVLPFLGIGKRIDLWTLLCPFMWPVACPVSRPVLWLLLGLPDLLTNWM